MRQQMLWFSLGLQWHHLDHMQTICTCSRQTTTRTPHRSIFTDRMLFLTHNQHRQSTEGTSKYLHIVYALLFPVPMCTYQVECLILITRRMKAVRIGDSGISQTSWDCQRQQNWMILMKTRSQARENCYKQHQHRQPSPEYLLHHQNPSPSPLTPCHHCNSHPQLDRQPLPYQPSV